MTEEELRAQDCELSDAELDNVAGGKLTEQHKNDIYQVCRYYKRSNPNQQAGRAMAKHAVQMKMQQNGEKIVEVTQAMAYVDQIWDSVPLF